MAHVGSVVRRCLTDHWTTGPGVVAVSGGADSVALLRALIEAGAGPLTVAHVNHGLRGAESDADEAFVRELAGALGVGFRSVRVNVAAEAETAGGNLEATARRVRYAFFGTVAAEVNAVWVATGHTADDQAETVLHRLVRGTGLQGLRGIAANQRFPAETGRLLLVRPLLTVTRADVLDSLTFWNQPFRTDSSNTDSRFTRNRIRAELLPLLKTFNPQIVSALGRLAGQVAEAHDAMTEQARVLLACVELPRAGDVVILDAARLTAPAATVRAVLRLIWEREGWPMGEMGGAQWDRAVAVLRKEANGWDFPGGISARHQGRVVQIGRQG